MQSRDEQLLSNISSIIGSFETAIKTKATDFYPHLPETHLLNNSRPGEEILWKRNLVDTIPKVSLDPASRRITTIISLFAALPLLAKSRMTACTPSQRMVLNCERALKNTRNTWQGGNHLPEMEIREYLAGLSALIGQLKNPLSDLSAFQNADTDEEQRKVMKNLITKGLEAHKRTR